MQNMLKKFDITGKTAIITGAGGLLGVEHAAALLECGADVILTDVNETSLNDALDHLKSQFIDRQISIISMDVTSISSISTAAQFINNANKDIQILINNAAIDPKVTSDEGIIESTRLENFSLEEWNRQINVGLTGAFLCSKVFGSLMASKGNGGVILNIASDLSVISPDQRLYQNTKSPRDQQPVKPVTYSVIKTGLVGLTRYLATYWADCGIRSNALSPGGVYNGQGDDFVHRLSSLIPLGRMAKREEYRSVVQFLCSDASAYLNGQNIVMDGGRSVW